MVRAGITLILFISVFAMMREISQTWRAQLPKIAVKTEKKVAETRDIPEKIALQPPVSPVIPDLRPGYLFNQERMLESEADKLAKLEEPLGNDLGIDADIAQLTYSGSLIGDTFSLALVNYPAGKSEKKPARTRGRQRSSAKKTTLESTRLKVGDVLSGYRVEEIDPDKIVFKKGEEVLEKFLYDPDKKREAPTRSAPASATPARPAPAAANAAAPGPATTGSAQATPQRPTRRVIVSRKPPPKPDTSRVIRRGRSSTPSVSTPPMPVLHR